MTVQIPEGFAQVALEMTHVGDKDPWYVTFGISTDTPTAQQDDYAETIALAWLESFGPELSSNVTTTAVTLTFAGGPDGRLVYRYALSIEGTSDVAKLPQNCALLVSKTTGLGGRKGRGRMYIPSILSEANVSDVGVLANGYVETYEAIARTFLETLADPTEVPGGAGLPSCPMYLLHNGATVPTLVTRLQVSPVISTQRRRLR